VFQQWGLPAATAEDPCLKEDWFGSLARNASIGCSCDGPTGQCRITHLCVRRPPRSLAEASAMLYFIAYLRVV
jgi:hypothetical protein